MFSTKIPGTRLNTGAYPLNLHDDGLYQYFRTTFSAAWDYVRFGEVSFRVFPILVRNKKLNEVIFQLCVFLL
jgi:hypothetical protein